MLYRSVSSVVARRYGKMMLLVPTTGDLEYVMSLNTTGALLWDQLRDSKTLDDLVCCLTEHYPSSSISARAEISKLLSDLLGMGLIEEVRP